MRAPKDNAHDEVGAKVTVLGGGVTGKADFSNGLPEHYALTADAVQASIDGQHTASEFLQALQRHYVDPDRLFQIVRAIDPPTDAVAAAKLRGLTRIIQKKLEASA